ncbi:MAG: hypothetical protein HYU77_15710 [Betaproteobacteria bacterium]|nr:hypothetical protein [Betaproteobacteria bacterium]
MAENLVYAVVQLFHNFGAVAVVGGAVAGAWPAPARAEPMRRLARLVCAAWAVQIASGAAFGAASYYYYGRFPDIHGIAIAALAVKAICAASGFLLAAAYLYRAARWSAPACERVWRLLAALGITALTAAAFLRWFS